MMRGRVQDQWDGSADYIFDDQQPWVPIQRTRGNCSAHSSSLRYLFSTVCFVDETEQTRSFYVCEIFSTPSPIPQSPHQSLLSQSPYRPQSGSSLPEPSNQATEISADTFSPPAFTRGVLPDSLALWSRSPLDFDSGPQLLPESPATSLGDAPKLFDEQEALLLRHYISALGWALDICDPHHHFSDVVPELATRSALLLNATLAASAHHLSRTSGFDPLVADIYHERCVELLIPLLNNLPTVPDEVIAATVLLRLFEQMSSGITGSDCERHLSGTSAFMNLESTCATAGGVRQASFWLFLRQALDVALSHQRPLKLNLEAYAVTINLDAPADDWTWANRIVWITAEAAAFLFGQEKSQAKYEELRIKADAWWQRKPQSFRPLYIARGAVFPEIFYTRPWHGKKQFSYPKGFLFVYLMTLAALAMQYYHTAMILLTIADTGRLKIGVGHRESRRMLQAEVADHASMLFGMCTGDDMQARLGACHVVSVCAPYITGRAQQEEIIRMLSRIERENAWPTRAIAFGAMDEWEWTDQDRRIFG